MKFLAPVVAALAFAMASMGHAQTVQIQQLQIAQAPIASTAGLLCAAPLGAGWRTYQCQMAGITATFTSQSNPWTAKQTFVASTTSFASINLPTGNTPTTPQIGDFWCTSANCFVQTASGTFNFTSPVGSVAGTAPISVTTAAGVATVSLASTFTGQWTTQGLTTTEPGWYAQITGDTFARVRVGINAADVASVALGSGSAARDVLLERAGAANLRHGSSDAAAPVAQTESVQNVVAGTANTAGVNWTFAGSRGTGTGAGGSFTFQLAPAGSTGSAQNALTNVLTLDSTKLATFFGNISAPGLTLSTTPLAAGSGGTGLNALGSGVATFLGVPSSANLAAALTDETGTGAAVFATGPALSNPTVTTQSATDNSTKAASTAFYQEQAGNLPAQASTGSAASGKVGEYLVATNAPSSATSGAAANITSFTATPGDWDFRGVICASSVSTGMTSLIASISTVSTTVQGFGTLQYNQILVANGSTIMGQTCVTVGPARLNFTTNTQVYLVGNATYTGTLSLSGQIAGRRPE